MKLYDFIDSLGVILPDTAAIKAAVIAAFKAAFGDDIDTDPSTPSGLLIAMLTEQADAVARNNAALANQINPSQATGVFLDGLAALTGIERIQASKTLVSNVLATGTVGAIIPAGTKIKTPNGDEFESANVVTISASGNAFVDFWSVETGAIACAPGDLDTDKTGVVGVDLFTSSTVTVTLGRKQETDSALRLRREQALAGQSMGTVEAIRTRVFAVEGVTGAVVRENNTAHDFDLADYYHLPPGSAPIILAHSVWACVNGGTDEEVARAIYESKSAGADYSGDTAVSIQDDTTGIPYIVRFQRPETLQIKIKVTVKASRYDAEGTIPGLIMAYASGEADGDQSFGIGDSISPWEIAGIINQGQPMFHVLEVSLALLESEFATNVLQLLPWQIAKIEQENIVVEVI